MRRETRDDEESGNLRSSLKINVERGVGVNEPGRWNDGIYPASNGLWDLI